MTKFELSATNPIHSQLTSLFYKVFDFVSSKRSRINSEEISKITHIISSFLHSFLHLFLSFFCWSKLQLSAWFTSDRISSPLFLLVMYRIIRTKIKVQKNMNRTLDQCTLHSWSILAFLSKRHKKSIERKGWKFVINCFCGLEASLHGRWDVGVGGLHAKSHFPWKCLRDSLFVRKKFIEYHPALRSLGKPELHKLIIN